MKTWGGAARPVANIALIVVSALSVGGCGDLDIIDHDALVEVPVGNFPDQAIERCGALPSGIAAIEGLESAWAIAQVPVKDRDNVFRVATSSLVLRLSNDGVPCEGVLEPEDLTCPAAWGVDITLLTTDPKPGLYPLDDYGQSYDLSIAERNAQHTCDRESMRGRFDAGVLEIFDVTDECITGRLIDTSDALDESGAMIEGGFVALRCTAQ